MLPATLTLLLALSPFEEAPQTPQPAEIARVVERLDKAFKDGTPADRAAALEAGIEVPADEVVERMAEALKDKAGTVVAAAVDALGRSANQKALETLEKHYRQHKKQLQKDPAMLAGVLKACARHGSESTIEILTDDPFGARDYQVVQARIYGLGNIRSKLSVEALIALSRKAGPNKVEGYMGDIRIALAELTGVDQGRSPELWGRWWEDNKKTFEIPEKPPELAPELRGRWRRYWATGRERPDPPGEDGESGEKRERRGG
jgi:HEAT repeats